MRPLYNLFYAHNRSQTNLNSKQGNNIKRDLNKVVKPRFQVLKGGQAQSPEGQGNHQRATQGATWHLSAARCTPAQYHTCVQYHIAQISLTIKRTKKLWNREHPEQKKIPGLFSSNIRVAKYLCSSMSLVCWNRFSCWSVGITYDLIRPYHQTQISQRTSKYGLATITSESDKVDELGTREGVRDHKS